MTDENRKNDKTSIIEDLTYEDYLSAVVTYETTCKELDDAVINAKNASQAYTFACDELKSLVELDAENRKKYNSVINEVAEKERELWTKSQARFDVRLSQKKAVAEMNAKSGIQKKKEEYEKALRTANDRVTDCKTKIEELEREYGELLEHQEELDRYEKEDSVPEDPDALAFLERARAKRLLSKVQTDLIAGDVKQPCRGRLTGFESLKLTEQELPKTEFYKALVRGDVTMKIFREVSTACAMIWAALSVLVFLMLYAVEPTLFSTIIHTAAATLSFGGLLASVTHVVRERYEQVRGLPLSERAMLMTAFYLGCVPGFFIGLFVYAPDRGLPCLTISVLCAAACALLLRRIMMTKLARRYIAKIPALKDMARKDIFEKFESEDNFKYSFMIFCYLCHNDIVTFLSMEYLQNERNTLGDKINTNRKDLKHFKEELKDAQTQLRRTEDERSAVEDFIKEQKRLLGEELRSIDSTRPPEPDFIENARVKCSGSLAPVEKQHKELEAQIEDKQNAIVLLETKKRAADEREQRLRAQKERTRGAIREWKKTPNSEAHIFGLLDDVCIDSRSRITVIHHAQEPHVLYYVPKQRRKDPAETIHLFIYRYIRGLCKINPRTIMQVNIFDNVSDPSILLNCGQYENIADDGVIRGVYSMDRFEVRLFSDTSGYSTFKDVLEKQCEKVKSFVTANSAKLPSGTNAGLAEVNKLIGTEKMFLFQVCIFIVPREEDKAAPPPKSFIRMIDTGLYKKYGVLPVFIADHGSVAQNWKSVIGKYKACGHIFSLN